jgi:hypothetical protein
VKYKGGFGRPLFIRHAAAVDTGVCQVQYMM